ncbi:hypothetical protein ACRAWD_32050 [Caulobacter segnis]
MEAHWRVAGDRVSLTLQVPANSRAGVDARPKALPGGRGSPSVRSRLPLRARLTRYSGATPRVTVSPAQRRRLIHDRCCSTRFSSTCRARASLVRMTSPSASGRAASCTALAKRRKSARSRPLTPCSAHSWRQSNTKLSSSLPNRAARALASAVSGTAVSSARRSSTSQCTSAAGITGERWLFSSRGSGPSPGGHPRVRHCSRGRRRPRARPPERRRAGGVRDEVNARLAGVSSPRGGGRQLSKIRPRPRPCAPPPARREWKRTAGWVKTGMCSRTRVCQW